MKTRRVEEQTALTTIPPEAQPYLRWADAEQLTCRQAAVLAIVTANPGVTVGAVAAVMGIPKPGVTRAADKLVDWGLMLRSVNRMDRRLVELHAKKAAPARMGRSTRGGG